MAERRKSWREIDQAKDGSGGSSRGGSGRERSSQGQRSQKSYRATLDRLFDSGKIGELVEQQSSSKTEPKPGDESRIKLLRKIQDATDRGDDLQSR